MEQVEQRRRAERREASVDGERHSLLFPRSRVAGSVVDAEQPPWFRDLNLEQMVSAMDTSEDGPKRLAGVFYSTSHGVDVVAYRQAIFQDLEDRELRAAVCRFKERLVEVERHLSGLKNSHDRREWQGWFLDAVLIYCGAVAEIDDSLRNASLQSVGLRSCRELLADYRTSAAFSELFSEATATREALQRITYCVRVRYGSAEVTRYQTQGDYREEIEEIFSRFRQGGVEDYRIEYRTPPHLGHVGSKVLEYVSRLYPEEFDLLERFCQRHPAFVPGQILQLLFEVEFYLSYLAYIEPIQAAGMAFCYPQVTSGPTESSAEATFDIVLARKLVAEGQAVVPNSFRLAGVERIFVVSGPNQGGKTTFARTFGQLHHLAALGCPVPGCSGVFGTFDKIFTHFQREEQLADLRGKLEDDLVRMRAILAACSDRSVVIMNETFASTTLNDARFLGSRVMKELIAREVRAVLVTFVDELASMGPQVVSLVSTVVPEDPARRTFHIVRSPANGLAYAMAIAQKYGVTYEQLKRELER